MSNINNSYDNLGKNSLVFFTNLLNILPYSLYSAAVLEAIFFSDARGLLIFLGCIINEVLIFIINIFSAPSQSAERINKCSIFKSGSSSISGSFGLPSAYMQRIGFFAGFILTYNIYHQKYNPLVIASIVFILLGLSFNLIVQGCTNLMEIVSGAVIGILIGFAYFMMIKNHYKEKTSYTSDDDFVCETVEVNQ